MALSQRLRGLGRLAAALLVAVPLVGDVASAWRIVNWNLLNYQPGREAHYKTVLNALQPDVLVVQEMDGGGLPTQFLVDVLNAADGPGGYLMATFTDNFGLDNALYYRLNTTVFTGNHVDLFTVGREIDRWTVRPAGYASSAAEVYVYSMHLKAGSTMADQNQRLAEATIARNDGNALALGSRFIYCGDFNVQDSSELSYGQQLTGSLMNNNGRGFDPINMFGNWNNNAGFAAIHTQSPHSNNAGAPPGASTGGMDDRFDFQLISNRLNLGEGIAYVPGTYRAYGNDGLHFNNDIDDPPTIPEGAAIATALHGASDHLPVVADYQVPPVVSAPSSLAFGTVVVGAVAVLDLPVANLGNLAVFGFVDDLDFNPTSPPGFSDPPGLFQALAGQPATLVPITMSTATPADRAGTLTVSSDDPETPVVQVSLTGRIVAHAVPSLSGSNQVLSAPLDFGAHLPGGFDDQDVAVHNLGFTSLQALLNVYDAQLSGSHASSFSIVGGFAPFDVGAAPAALSVAFDDSGPGGTYTADLVLSTRDDPALPGAGNLPDLTIPLSATLVVPDDAGSGRSLGGPLRGPITLSAGSAGSGLALSASGLSPGGPAVFVVGRRRGSELVAGCLGTHVGIADYGILAVARADAAGGARVRVPPAARRLEPLLIQVVDPISCRVSPLVRLAD